MTGYLKNFCKTVSNIHIPDGKPNVFLFATPRGGSTWFMELVSCQPGFRYCAEPLDVRVPEVRKYSTIQTWEELYRPETTQRFERYFDGLLRGKINFRNPNPLQSHYRLLTRRVVFKIIHGGVDRINWFRDRFKGRIMLVLRHPVAVSISREEYPFLPYFPDSEYRRQFSNAQVQIANEVIEKGSKLEKGVLAWCLHNSVPLRDAGEDWAIVTYEQAILEPLSLIDYICDKLELPDAQRIIRQLKVPSRVMQKSDSETRHLLAQRQTSDMRQELVSKWMHKTEDQDVRNAMELLDVFGIDAYRYGEVLPSERYWIGDRPAQHQ